MILLRDIDFVCKLGPALMVLFLSMEKVLLFLDYLLFADCNFYFKYIVSENRCKIRLVCSWKYHLEKDLFFKLQTVKIFNNKNFELEFNRFFFKFRFCSVEVDISLHKINRQIMFVNRMK